MIGSIHVSSFENKYFFKPILHYTGAVSYPIRILSSLSVSFSRRDPQARMQYSKRGLSIVLNRVKNRYNI